jgi:hypothetical protein
MVEKSYGSILKYPLTMWVAFEIVLLAVGFTRAAAATGDMLFGTGVLFVALLFGTWVGRRSALAFPKYSWVSVLSAFMLILITGFVAVLFGYVLSTYSAPFNSMLAPGSSPGGNTNYILTSSVASWVEMGIIALIGAALAYEFTVKR